MSQNSGSDRRATGPAQRHLDSKAFEKLVQSVADYAIYMLDETGTVISWNAGAERIKQYSAQEIIGQHFSKFYAPEDQVADVPGMALSVARRDKHYEADGWRVRKDGSRFWASVVIHAIHDDDGSLIGFAKITRDMTERRQAEAQLREAREELLEAEKRKAIGRLIVEQAKLAQELRASDARFRSTFDKMPIGLALVSPDLQWLWANDRFFEISLYSRGDFFPTLSERVVTHHSWADFAELMGKFRRGDISQAELKGDFIGRNGKKIIYRTMLTRATDDEGNTEFIILVTEDRTNEANVEAQLRQAQKMEAIGNLTGGLAHDFNNLLGVVIGNLDLLEGLLRENDEAMELSQAALQAALRGADLTRRLLAFARRQPLQPLRVDVNSLIVDLVRLLKPILGEDIELTLQLADEICPVLVDPAQLDASLTNLATNARDAMPTGGKLQISTGCSELDQAYTDQHPEIAPGRYVWIRVTDCGCGIPTEIMPRIFEPFVTTKQPERGTGLGLSMVFGFIKQSGGHINVYSEEGQGTSFTIYLPCVEHGTPEDNEHHKQQHHSNSGHGETILVAEDNGAFRKVVVHQLQNLGYFVREAIDAKQAIAELQHGDIDLLLTDIVMPGGMSGLQLAQEAQLRWPELRIILTSGFPGGKFEEDLSNLNLRLLVKPYRQADLAQMVRDVLDF